MDKYDKSILLTSLNNKDDSNNLEEMQTASKVNASRFTIDQVRELWMNLFKDLVVHE